MAKPEPSLMEKVVSLCKRRGFVFPASEIYGGIGNTYDYGPLGVELKRRVKDSWWARMVTMRDDIVGLDSAIIQNPKTWETSGHVTNFTDPMVDCKKCKARFRADKLEDARCPEKPSKRPGECGGELTEARAFNLMFRTNVGPVEGAELRVAFHVWLFVVHVRVPSAYARSARNAPLAAAAPEADFPSKRPLTVYVNLALTPPTTASCDPVAVKV